MANERCMLNQYIQCIDIEVVFDVESFTGEVGCLATSNPANEQSTESYTSKVNYLWTEMPVTA